jgi:hypothetical protein
MAIFNTQSTGAQDRPFESLYNRLITLLNQWAAGIEDRFGLYLPLTGGTLTGAANTTKATGALSVVQTSADSESVFSINGAAGFRKAITWMTGGLNRWRIQSSNTAEAGADAGSNLLIDSFTDAGVYKETVLTINRASGAISIPKQLTSTLAVGTAPFAVTSTTVVANLNAAQVGGYTPAQLLLLMYPVGAIYTSVVSTDPGTLFGGTWAAFAAGRVLVGIDSGDTSFDTVEETGGAKTVQSSAQTFAGTAMATHIHNAITAGTPAGTIGGPSATTAITGGGATAVGSGTHTHTFTGTALGTHQHPAKTAGTPAGTNTPGAATSVVQPYIVVYMWKRTA